MAPADFPPAAEEEEESLTSGESSDEESASDSDDASDSSPPKSIATQEPAAPKTAISEAPKSEPSETPKSNPQESSDDDSDEESDSDSTPFIARPISKAAATPTKRPVETEIEPSPAAKRTKKTGSGNDNPGTSTPTKPSTAGKRGKKKIFGDDINSSALKSPRRTWSEDEEMAILQGILDIAAKNGSFASSDMRALHDSLQLDCSKLQIAEKVRSLKNKYLKFREKNSEPSKPVEKKAFELSKAIWSENGVAEESKPNGTAVKKTAPKPKPKPKPVKEISKPVTETPTAVTEMLTEGFRIDLALQLRPTGFPDSVVKQGLELVPGEKRSELEAKWREIHMAELELYVKRSQLISEQGKLILEAFNSSNV